MNTSISKPKRRFIVWLSALSLLILSSCQSDSKKLINAVNEHYSATCQNYSFISVNVPDTLSVEQLKARIDSIGSGLERFEKTLASSREGLVESEKNLIEYESLAASKKGFFKESYASLAEESRIIIANWNATITGFEELIPLYKTGLEVDQAYLNYAEENGYSLGYYLVSTKYTCDSTEMIGMVFVTEDFHVLAPLDKILDFMLNME